MKKMTFFIPLFLLLWKADAQTGICLEYDNAGNRVSRNDCISAFAPNGEEQSAAFKLPENATLVEGEVRLLPNPTTGIFQLQTNDFPAETNVSVFDALGRVLFYRQLGDGQFDLSTRSAGTYYIRIVKGGVQKTVVLIKSDR